MIVTCSFEVDPQGFDTNPATFAMLFAKFEMARFLAGFDLIKSQLKVNGITSLKVGCFGSKPNRSLNFTLEKVIKIDSCTDDKKAHVTIKKKL